MEEGIGKFFKTLETEAQNLSTIFSSVSKTIGVKLESKLDSNDVKPTNEENAEVKQEPKDESKDDIASKVVNFIRLVDCNFSDTKNPGGSAEEENTDSQSKENSEQTSHEASHEASTHQASTHQASHQTSHGATHKTEDIPNSEIEDKIINTIKILKNTFKEASKVSKQEIKVETLVDRFLKNDTERVKLEMELSKLNENDQQLFWDYYPGNKRFTSHSDLDIHSKLDEILKLLQH